MPFGQPGMLAGALGMQKNKQMQNKQQQAGQGIGPSAGMMGGMMPGRRMGQQAQKPGNRMGQSGGGLGQMVGALGASAGYGAKQMQAQQQPILGGGSYDGAQSRRFGKQFKMPMQPRQDMYDYGQGQIGMSNTRLPQNEPMQQDPMPSEPMQPPMAQQLPAQQMDPMQEALARYGPKNSALKRQGGIGPRFM